MCDVVDYDMYFEIEGVLDILSRENIVGTKCV